uniref:Uncharacterized protein n=1 Tax=Daucus carota subsp. sativus TaxID=79200 RepID=A0A162AKM1_DAUCS
MDASELGFPVRHKKLSVDITLSCRACTSPELGARARVSHVNQVIATQIGSLGTIINARKEEGVLTNPTFHVSVIFGKRDEPVLVACARQLIEHISNSGSSRPLILSLGLKDHSLDKYLTSELSDGAQIQNLFVYYILVVLILFI